MENADSVFLYNDYKDFIRFKLSSGHSQWGSITHAAKAAKCQRSHFSRVISSHLHLTLEHGYGLCEFWKLSSPETAYFMALLEKARAGSKSYKQHLDSRLLALKRENQTVSNRLKATPRTELSSKELTYYASWYLSALHLIVSIPQFQTTKSISVRLGLPESLVESSLQFLEKAGWIRSESGRWMFQTGEVHLGKGSPLVAIHHQNWRQRAVNDAQMDSEGLHYTAVQTVSRDAFEKIKEVFLRSIEESAKIGDPSDSEELICISCDCFVV